MVKGDTDTTCESTSHFFKLLILLVATVTSITINPYGCIDYKLSEMKYKLLSFFYSLTSLHSKTYSSIFIFQTDRAGDGYQYGCDYVLLREAATPSGTETETPGD